jgi:hypothetical protein
MAVEAVDGDNIRIKSGHVRCIRAPRQEMQPIFLAAAAAATAARRRAAVGWRRRGDGARWSSFCDLSTSILFRKDLRLMVIVMYVKGDVAETWRK